MLISGNTTVAMMFDSGCYENTIHVSDPRLRDFDQIGRVKRQAIELGILAIVTKILDEGDE